ncbi:hypothetical protein CEP54_006222 [Fusarium duplospermum]|uniref:Uncharacterized protein n=1 Tax=Fusarium duplospermum TaxID=1325734 RepID=A0A428Q816_9HYPO|nr:hypothetical protein CEP54_006222 [Fusarium duplospermum]
MDVDAGRIIDDDGNQRHWPDEASTLGNEAPMFMTISMFGLASVYKDEASARGQGDTIVETLRFGVDGVRNYCPTKEREEKHSDLDTSDT